MATTGELAMLEVARAAARARSVARREMRERVLQQRLRLGSTLQDSRRNLGQQLLSSAGLEQADLDTMRTREEEVFRRFVAEERRAVACRSRPTGLDQPPRLRRGSPFPDAPQLGFQLVQLDTATFIGPPLDETGADSRNLVVPDPPAAGHNFARALVDIDSGHQSGFDPGHINFEFVEFFFAFTADSDVQMNAVSFVDWNGGYTLLAGWYPFDSSWAEAAFTLGMDARIAVGTPVTGRPPHKTVRARFTHTAPTSGA
jgi:hypothetical protein